MAPPKKNMITRKPISKPQSLVLIAKSEIATMDDNITIAHDIIMVSNKNLIHLFNRCEWTLAIFNYFFVPKMLVCRKPKHIYLHPLESKYQFSTEDCTIIA